MNDDDEDVTCPHCDVVFQVTWHRNAWTVGIDYCPFCGEEWERQVAADDDAAE